MYDRLLQITPCPRDHSGCSLIRVYDPFNAAIIQQEFAGVVNEGGGSTESPEEDGKPTVVCRVTKTGECYVVQAPWGERRKPTTSVNQLRILMNQRDVAYFWSTWGEELSFVGGEALEKDWEKDVDTYNVSGKGPVNDSVSADLNSIGNLLGRVLDLIEDLSDSIQGVNFLSAHKITPDDVLRLRRLTASYKGAAIKSTPVDLGH